MIKSFFTFIVIVVIGLVSGAGATITYNAVASKAEFFIKPFAATPPSEPMWLDVPSIGVHAPIKPVGVDKKGNVGVPADASHVAWYKYGPRPGMPGVAVMDGHLDTKTSPRAVFYNLDQLKLGDEVNVLTVDNQKISFKVKSLKDYPYNASTSDIFISTSSVSQLVLVTCTGDWVPEKKIYNQRLVVFAE